MNLKSILLGLALAAASTAGASNLPVRYLVEMKPLTGLVAGSIVTTELYSDPACTNLIGTTDTPIEDIQIEKLKPFTPKGANKPVPLLVLRLNADASGATADVFARLTTTIDGTIVAHGGDCQVQNPRSAGAQGPQGPDGPQGPTGPQGPQGPQGPAGFAGPQGPTGAQGPIGAQGAQGATGAQGAQGPRGARGPMNVSGAYQVTAIGENACANTPMNSFSTHICFLTEVRVPDDNDEDDATHCWIGQAMNGAWELWGCTSSDEAGNAMCKARCIQL